jgi:hypothetical protein
MKNQCKLLLALLLLPIIVFANSIDLGKYTKQREIKKAYFVNPDAGISIKNSYGNVFVTTWDEDKIELIINIKVSGDNEKWVEKRIEDIDVSIEALKTMVTAETILTKSLYTFNGKNNSFEINYTVKIPKNGSVKIKNNYGSIITTDLYASTNLSCEYGKITLGKLNGNSNTISFDYCQKSSIEYVKNASISADYSGFTLAEFGKVNLKADYTDCSLGIGNELKYDCNYAKLNLGNISTIEGSGDYLNIRLKQLSNTLKIATDYSKITVDKIEAKANSVTIDSEYTAVELGFDADFAFNFDVNLRYANFKYDNDFEFNSKQEKTFSKSYQGYYKKSGVNKVTIQSDYGNVTMHQN